MEKITAFLDTSAFFSENFIDSCNIKRLLQLASNNEINLVITDIVYNEILSNYIKSIDEAIPTISSTFKQRNKVARVLRNHDELMNLFFQPELDKEKLIQSFKNKLDTQIETSHVEIIGTGHLTIKNVMQAYFDKRPPFSEKKKYEFPDAFSIEGIKEFCARKKMNSIYIIAKDSDIKFIPEKRFIVLNAVSDLLDKYITQKNEMTATLNHIKELYKSNQEKLKICVKDEFIDYIENGNIQDRSFREIIDIADPIIKEIEFEQDYNLIELNDRFAFIEAYVHIEYEIEYTYHDISNAYYDDEDKLWIPFGEAKSHSEDKQYFLTTIRIDYNPPAGFIFGDAKLLEIDLSKV